MIALRQLKRVPKNHKLIIDVPETIAEHQIMEVILLFKEIPQISRIEKIAQLKESQHDPLFLKDLQTVYDDFADIDNKEW